MTGRLPLALTMGEPAGIGGEIALKAWIRRQADDLPPFVLLDAPERLNDLSARLNLDCPIETVTTPAAAKDVFHRALPVLPIPLPITVEPGHPDPRNANAVIAAIDRAVDLALAGNVAGVVTNPIAKATLYAGGFTHPGHTEHIAARTGASGTMMLAVPGLKVVLVTIHLPLRRALDAITTPAIVATAQVTARALATDFGLARPRIAIAGLNPHAGEDGSIGREDIDIVAPAIAQLRAKGIDASGPWPPDTMFHDAARARYDAAICLYHDQGLIPLKTIDFAHGVNITLGLPIVRTSPDHGTAFDIAGTGRADPASLVAALHTAANIADHRRRG